MKRTPTLPAPATLLALATLATLTLSGLTLPDANASPHGRCDSGGKPALGIISIGGVAYVDDRNYLQGNGTWIYRETNGLAGLQRGGSSPYVPGDADICYDDSASGPDQLVY